MVIFHSLGLGLASLNPYGIRIVRYTYKHFDWAVAGLNSLVTTEYPRSTVYVQPSKSAPNLETSLKTVPILPSLQNELNANRCRCKLKSSYTRQSLQQTVQSNHRNLSLA